MFSIICASFAKINLRLKITGRDERGYHRLSMINYLVNFADELSVACNHQATTFEVNTHPRVIIDETFSDPTKNLVLRAASMLEGFFEEQIFFNIKLEKNVPLGSGLGGGSSNAAAMLLAGWQLAIKKLALSTSQQEIHYQRLLKMAPQLGYDVPFFMLNSAAIVSSFGEQLQPFDSNLTDQEILLFLPAVSCQTADVYQNFRQLKPAIQITEDLAVQGFAQGSSSWKTLIENDLLLAVVNNFPALAELNADLLRSLPAGSVGMTGSGSTFFAFPSIGLQFAEDELALAQQVASSHGCELVKTKLC